MSRPETTRRLTRGVRRALDAAGAASISEFVPARGVRVDVVAVERDGTIVIVEVKSGLDDLRADKKWSKYREWCDRLYFAVDAGFPIDALDSEVGVMRADGYDAVVVRDAPEHRLAPARRRALLLRITQDAARRLLRFEDPGLGDGG